MKKLLTLLCMFALLSLSSAQSETDLQEFIERENLQPSPIKTYKVKLANLKTEFGEVIQEEAVMFLDIKINRRGIRTQYAMYMDGDTPWRFFGNEYKYDENNKIVERFLYDYEGNLMAWWKYDENENMIESHNPYILEDEYIELIKSEYTDNGNLSITTFYLEDGSIHSQYKFKYDEYGNKIEEIEYDFQGELRKKILYNQDENIVQESMFYNGALRWQYNYKYDANGNQIEKTSLDDRENKNVMEVYIDWKGEYDENNNQVIGFSYNYDSEIESIFRYKHDSYGNTIETARYNQNDVYIGKTTKKYNEQNDVIEISYYDSSNKLSSQEICTFEKFDIYQNWTKRTCLNYNESFGGWQPDYNRSNEEVTLKVIEYHE